MVGQSFAGFFDQFRFFGDVKKRFFLYVIGSTIQKLCIEGTHHPGQQLKDVSSTLCPINTLAGRY
jgi:hypothetical protein